MYEYITIMQNNKNIFNHNKKARRKKRYTNKRLKYDEYDTETCFLGVVKSIITNKLAVVLDINLNINVHCKMRNKIDCRQLHIDDVVIYSDLSVKTSVYNGDIHTRKIGEILAKISPNDINDCMYYFNININKLNIITATHTNTSNIILNNVSINNSNNSNNVLTNDCFNVSTNNDYFNYDMIDSDNSFDSDEPIEVESVDVESVDVDSDEEIKTKDTKLNTLNIDNI